MPTLDPPDDVLAARASGARYDTRAFEELVRRHQGFVVANCRVLSRSPTDAEDLAQEVFIKAYFGISSYAKKGSFRSWLKRIKVNHCLNFLRRNRGRTMLDIEGVPATAADALTSRTDPEQALQAREERSHIVAVLDTMGETLRIPLMLRDGDGFSYQEIADRLGVGLSAVKMRIKRGREEFRRLYVEGRPEAPESSPIEAIR